MIKIAIEILNFEMSIYVFFIPDILEGRAGIIEVGGTGFSWGGGLWSGVEASGHG